MDFVEKARIMDGPRINRALARLASEIVEENHGAGDLYLVGIRRRGVPLAERMADKIADLEGARPPVGVLDITLVSRRSLNGRSQTHRQSHGTSR